MTRLEEEIYKRLIEYEGKRMDQYPLTDLVIKGHAIAAAEVAQKYADEFAVHFLNYTMHRKGEPTEESKRRIEKMLSDFKETINSQALPLK